MLVSMKYSDSIQMAYKSPINDICAVCKEIIPQGEYLTRHLAPDPRRYNRITGKTQLMPYIACIGCAPYTQLENHTGELDLRAMAERARLEDEETEVLQVIRTNTPRPTHEGEKETPRTIRAVLSPVRLKQMGVQNATWG